MAIETKFSPGDNVWVMRDNKPHMFKINAVSVTMSEEQIISESYIEFERGITLVDSDKINQRVAAVHTKEYQYPHDKCFATKEELLQSFLNKD